MRLICFVYPHLEPSGGWGDVLKLYAETLQSTPSPARVFGSEDEALKYVDRHTEGEDEIYFVEIVDLDTLLLVAQFTNGRSADMASSTETWIRIK